MSVFPQLLYGFCILLLISCSTTANRYSNNSSTEINAESEGHYKFDAWRLQENEGFAAINALLVEADLLIENKSYDAAADKLERVLRIKPDYAPAWSRLSWLALESNAASRSLQMARRSNSFAYTNPELQFLNWSFIRTASRILQDEESYAQAVLKMKSLKAF